MHPIRHFRGEGVRGFPIISSQKGLYDAEILGLTNLPPRDSLSCHLLEAFLEIHQAKGWKMVKTWPAGCVLPFCQEMVHEKPWKAIIFCWKKLSLDDEGWTFTYFVWRANLQLRKRKPQGDLPHVTWDRRLILYERPGAQPLLCSSTRDALEARYGTIWQLPCVKQQLWRLWMQNHSYMNFEVTGKVWWLHSTLLPIQGRCPR